MKDFPKISIITPSFNQGQYIEETILSVLSQNYPNLEYIIIDGGSTDQTVQIIRKYEKKITYWISEPDSGQSDAINKGLKIATGDVFNWINSDDLLAPNSLWTIGQYFLQRPKTTLLLGNLQTIKEGKPFGKPYAMTFVKDNLAYNMIFSGMTQPSVFYRLNNIKQLGEVNTQLYFCMDFELWCRFITLFGLNDIGFTNETLAYFRVHSMAKSQSTYMSYLEKRNILLSMLFYLGVKENYLQRLNNNTTNIVFNNKWDFKKHFFRFELLIAYIIEHILTIPHYQYSIKNSFYLWFISFRFAPLNRKIYFYSLPLRLVYRKIKKLL